MSSADQLPNTTWPCPRCKVPQVISAMYCASCGLPLGAATPEPDPEDNPVSAAVTTASRWAVPIVVIGVVLVVLYVIVGGSRAGTAAPPDPAAGVQWQDYAPAVRTRIDGLGAAKDCPGLQAEFDAADKNNTSTMNRTGHNNAQLMAYIDALLRSSGCY